MRMSLRRLLLGNPLRSSAEKHERLSAWQALAVFSSDALSSVAYATEEILLVLITVGPTVLWMAWPLSLAIVALLAVVTASYFQTIHGYPLGGGAYIVAHENLRPTAGLVAAAALLLDYVLTVAVSITAGVFAFVSAFPATETWRVELCVLSIVGMTLANLRGVRDSGRLFAVPTYIFIGCVSAMIVTGIVRYSRGVLTHADSFVVGDVTTSAKTVGLLLVVRAFSSGCTALTGVEAISNGIPAFRAPEATNAGRTLLIMAVLLGSMFLGTTFLACQLHLQPLPQESIVSQIGRTVWGKGVAYYVLQGATTLILILAANTSFADFPRLASILARAEYLPRQMARRGDRLASSNGVILLGSLAIMLVIIFQGQTHRLIPLYAVGVFLAFSLSQLGMVVHWNRLRGARWRIKSAINGLGALTTMVVLGAIVESKFIHGAWIVLILIPLSVGIFQATQRHYRTIRRQLRPRPDQRITRASRSPGAALKIVIPVSEVHRGTLAAVQFAATISNDVTAVHVDLDDERTDEVRRSWQHHVGSLPLHVVASPYRELVRPLERFIREVDERSPELGLAVVVLPEFIPARWWHLLLHNSAALLLKTSLLYHSRQGLDRIIIDVPYHLDE